MADNDYNVLAYKVLSHLYACLKAGQCADLTYLRYGTEQFPISEKYWSYLFSHLLQDGYIENVSLLPILGLVDKQVKLDANVMITPKGISYLQNDSAMNKVKSFLEHTGSLVSTASGIVGFMK